MAEQTKPEKCPKCGGTLQPREALTNLPGEHAGNVLRCDHCHVELVAPSADPIEETNRFYDHSTSGADAVFLAALAEGANPSDVVVFIIDASKGKGRTLAAMIAKRDGKTLEDVFADVPGDQDWTLTRALAREDAATMVATWNSRAASLIAPPPSPGTYTVVVMAAGVTRVLDRAVPKPMAIA